MGKLQFGISSMQLGPCVQERPDSAICLPEWEKAAVINRFYRAGGHPLPASPTECRFLWDEQALYVLFICGEGPRDWEGTQTREEGRLLRKDRVEIAVSSGSFGHRDFSVFTAHNDGSTSALTQRGMTYLGGDKAYLGGRDRVGNTAEITELKKDSYCAHVAQDKRGWMAYFAVPWELAGGIPKERFYLQVYRIKHQTSEIDTPFPLDLQVNFSDRFEYDPLTFLEVYLNGEAETASGEDVLFTLPSGILRWQRPTMLVWPDARERKAIEALHQDRAKTTPHNLSGRVRLLQRWQDTLTLEGLDYFTGQSVTNPWEFREPWVERRLCNEALRKGDIEGACREVDTAIAYFARLTGWWYADHTLGNQDSGRWKELGTLREVSKTGNRAELTFRGPLGERSLFCSAAAGGFRFSTEHLGFFSAQESGMEITYTGKTVNIEADCGRLVVETGKDWTIRKEGADFVLNSSRLKFLTGEDGNIQGTSLELRLGEEESVYGFGECFDGVNQRGSIRTLWQRDACEGCLASIGNQSYKNIPFIHLSSGYSIFLNSHYRIRADVGNENKDSLRLQSSGPVTDFYLWSGTPAAVMDGYSQLTGRPLLPPKWVFEPWAGGGAGRWYLGPLHDICREQMAVLEQFEELDIPHAGFYAEGAGAQWFREPKKEELYKIVSFAQKKGIHVFSWQFPDMPMEEAEKLLPGVAPENMPVTRTVPHEGAKKLPQYIDFTHPLGKDLLYAQWETRLDAGISGTMADFGDFVPDEAVFYDGRRGDEMHNGYAYEYARAYRRLFYEKYGEDHVVYTRSAGAGSQAFACQFGGDHLTSFLGMTYSIHGGITAAASGLPFWGVDAAGYDGFPDEETYIRWTQWACFCPIMRYHGTNPREPWEYSRETVRIYKRYAWLRENILPYSYGLAVNAHETGMPLMRPLLMEFPDEPDLGLCGDEYFYGPDLLVAPIHQEGECRRIVFPKGSWVSLWDNHDIIQGPCTKEVHAPLDLIPVYLREGAFLPLELNGSLKLGESMTTSRKKVLMLAVPQTERQATWRQDRTDTINYKIQPSDDGFTMFCHGTGEWTYLLLRGLTDTPHKIIINTRQYPQCAARTALYFQEGWFLKPDKTVIVRVYDHTDMMLQVQY